MSLVEGPRGVRELEMSRGHSRAASPSVYSQSIVLGVTEIVSGAAGGTAAVAAGQPFDTIKTKLQTFPKVYRNVVVGIKKTFLEGGVRAYYAGSVPAVITATNENAVLFLAYSRNVKVVQRFFGVKDEKLLKPWQHGCAGSMSSVFSAMVVCPTEMIKCRLQVQRQIARQKAALPGARPITVNVRDVVRMIYRQDGFTGYFRGLTTTWARDIPGYFVFFSAKSLFHQGLDKMEWKIGDSFKTFLSGGLGGCALWMVSFPMDAIKSRIQVKASPYSALTRALYHVITTEGVWSLYKGIGPALARSFPANAALWLAYDTSKAFFNGLSR